MDKKCFVITQNSYDVNEITRQIEPYIDVRGCKRVFIKPNMVINPWKGEENDWVATVTHPSIIEAVLRVIKKQNSGNLEVIIGDAPMARSRHNETLRLMGLKEIISKYEAPDFPIQLIDIRQWYWKHIANMCVSRHQLEGDPLGNKLVNLFHDSVFFDKPNKNYEAFDNIHAVSEFHNEQDNIYSVSASVLSADVFINLPKLKTHRIAGMTCAMKNLVGINSNKNCVPHNTCGSDKQGGDAYPAGEKNGFDEMRGVSGKLRRLLRTKNPVINYCFIPVKMVYDRIQNKKGNQEIGYGMWYGNDTIWRSIVDLNRIILYCGKDGKMYDTPQRKYLCITDAIIAGESEGPLHPKPKAVGKILVADNPVVIDAVAVEIAGFDWKKLPFLYYSFDQEINYPLTTFSRDEIQVFLSDRQYSICEVEKLICNPFIPTNGWKGHIEKKTQ